MHRSQRTIVVLALSLSLVLALRVVVEGIDVRVEHDKTFAFNTAKTWAWKPEGAGTVVVARTQEDDAEEMKRRVDPWIRDAVQTELMLRGMQQAPSQANLIATYYLLLGTNMSTQTLGQFLPATAAWGLPPFTPATQSMKMMNQGSLVLDLSSKDTVVWRGVAQAKISFDTDNKKREALVRQGVKDLLKKFPPKK